MNLWKKRLGLVPESVWEQIELETLILADNDWTEVSEWIGRLRKLRMLDLAHNLLTGVPEAVGDLESLTDFLYLHDNRLASLPDSIWRLTGLREMHLRNNRLTALPQSMENLRELRQIDLRGNPLTHLPELSSRWSGSRILKRVGA